jgi:hypothetical protein
MLQPSSMVLSVKQEKIKKNFDSSAKGSTGTRHTVS